MQPRAYSYLRFSTPEQMQGDSFRRQTQLAQQYAQRHDLKLDTQLTLSDLGVSAFRGKNARTGALGAFLKAVDEGIVPDGSLLLVESLDRVTRQDPWDALPLFQQIINAGITIVTLQDAKTYSKAEMRANPMRILESLFVMIRANEESATKARRLKAAWEGKRLRAKERPLTARAPHWLKLNRDTRKFEVIKERAEVVRRVFAMTLKGIGQHKIVATFNKEHVPVFGNGKHWHRSYVNKLLNNPAVIGTMIPHTLDYDHGKKHRKPGEPLEGYYPAVIERSEFENVQSLLRGGRSPLRGRHAANGTVSNIFGGLARCPLCNSSMTRVNKGVGGGRPFLVCSSARVGGGCRPYHAVPYQQTEEAFVRDGTFIAANAPTGNGSENLDAQIEEIETQIDGTKDAIANLLQAIEGGRSRAVTERLRDLEDSLEELQDQHGKLQDQRAEAAGPLVSQRLAALHDALLQAPTALDRARVNLLLRQLVLSVTVDHRSGRLVLRWKHGGETSVVFAWPGAEL
jgi:DNA invertase Pin-like site-specific DNA recombinase